MKKGFRLLTGLAAILSLTSCRSMIQNLSFPDSSSQGGGTPATSQEGVSSQGGASSASSKTGSSSTAASVPVDTGDGYHKATEVNKNTKFTDFQDTCPTTGTINVLVLPIEFSDYPFSASDIQDIKDLTGGTAEDTKYWESLGSFYEKSSYGNLKFEFTYADKYSLGKTASSYYSSRSSTQDWADYAINQAVTQYKKSNSTTKFDSNGDGFIDAVIALYSAPHMQESSAIASIDSSGDCFWAYQYYVYDNIESANPSSPVPFCYFWASLYFFYEGTGSKASHTGVDAHTLTHEMGHVLGADDYYNYDQNDSGTKAEPSGQNVMMGYNILDHDAFTKLSYGWVKPYIPDSSCVITLNPTESSGDCILLADSWNGTAFDEYVILEFYTPTGLNYKDSHTRYSTRSLGYSQPGIRVTHVDARLAKVTYEYSDYYGWSYKSHTMLTDTQVQNGVGSISLTSAQQIEVANSNTPSYSKEGKNLMSLVSPAKTKFTGITAASNKDLFKAGDSFTLSGTTWSKYFPNGSKLNNGNALPWSFTVNEITDSKVTISITKA